MKKLVIFTWIIWFFLFIGVVWSAPSITSTSGDVTHGNTSFVITGTGFLTKSPAAPLVWDDCEDETVDTAPDSNANSYSQVGYSEILPDPANVGEAWELKYRSIPRTPVAVSIGAPHSRSTKYLCGGHEDTGTFSDSSNVALTVATPSAFENRWYTHYYYRINDDWPSCGASGANHKMLIYQAGTQAYSNSPYTNEYIYADYASHPCNDSGYVEQKVMPLSPLVVSESETSVPDSTPPWDYYIPGYNVDSPRDG